MNNIRNKINLSKGFNLNMMTIFFHIEEIKNYEILVVYAEFVFLKLIHIYFSLI